MIHTPFLSDRFQCRFEIVASVITLCTSQDLLAIRRVGNSSLLGTNPINGIEIWKSILVSHCNACNDFGLSITCLDEILNEASENVRILRFSRVLTLLNLMAAVMSFISFNIVLALIRPATLSEPILC